MPSVVIMPTRTILGALEDLKLLSELYFMPLMLKSSQVDFENCRLQQLKLRDERQFF